MDMEPVKDRYEVKVRPRRWWQRGRVRMGIWDTKRNDWSGAYPGNTLSIAYEVRDAMNLQERQMP